MQVAALLTGLVALALSACSPHVAQPVEPHPAADAAQSYREYTDALERSSVGEFLSILANGDARLATQLESSFEQAADAHTHPEGASALPELAEVYPFHLWAAMIERMREMRLVSGFDPRAGIFDPRVVRLQFLPEGATSSWRPPADPSDWVAGLIELDRLSRQSGMRLVALDNGSDSYLFAVVRSSQHDRLVELGSVVGQRVRDLAEIPF